MAVFFRSFLRGCLILSLTFALGACSGGLAAGLNLYQSSDGRYAFSYPTGWTRVSVNGGPKVVFHDLINSDETLSLVVSKIDSEINLNDLGSPLAVGERLITQVIAPEGSDRSVELVQAGMREEVGHLFYDIEYSVHLKDRDRHELATFVTDRGYLYTLATSTNENRWPKVKNLFERVIESFTFLI